MPHLKRENLVAEIGSGMRLRRSAAGGLNSTALMLRSEQPLSGSLAVLARGTCYGYARNREYNYHITIIDLSKRQGANSRCLRLPAHQLIDWR